MVSVCSTPPGTDAVAPECCDDLPVCSSPSGLVIGSSICAPSSEVTVSQRSSHPSRLPGGTTDLPAACVDRDPLRGGAGDSACSWVSPVPVLLAPRLRPHSKSQATSGLASKVHRRAPRTGLDGPLAGADSSPAVAAGDAVDDDDLSTTFTSFDEVQGDRALTGRSWWRPRQYEAAAVATSALQGQPTARTLQHELPVFPSPQVAITQDRGTSMRRAVVFDAQPLRGSVETLDCIPGQSVMSALTSLRSVPDIRDAFTGFALGALACVVNGLRTDLVAALPPDADVVQFLSFNRVDGVVFAAAPIADLLAQSAPGTMPETFGPHSAGDARSFAPPLPVDSQRCRRRGIVSEGSQLAASSEFCALPIPDTIALGPGLDRYTVLGTLEGATNRHRGDNWNPNDCLQDAVAHTVRSGQYHHGRIVRVPIPGLFVPQIIISRVCRFSGWTTVAVDFRALNLGIKVIDARVGSTIRQLFQPGSMLHVELTALGRGDRFYTCFMDQTSCPCDQQISGATDSLTLVERASGGPNTFRLYGVSAPGIASAQAGPAAGPSVHPRHATADGLDGGASRALDTIFTVFDRVNHFRVLPCRVGASAQELAAAALAATPELPQARGLRLRRGIPGLPDPQIVLFEDDVRNRVTPVVYLDNPTTTKKEVTLLSIKKMGKYGPRGKTGTCRNFPEISRGVFLGKTKIFMKTDIKAS